MFAIMFMRQKRNEMQMRLLCHVNTDYAALWDPVRSAWIQRRTQMTQCFSCLALNFKLSQCVTRQLEGFSVYTSPLFTVDLL